jgi:hypothetical protein
MLLSRQQNGGQNHDIKIGNRCFGNVEQFRYLGTTIMDGRDWIDLVQDRDRWRAYVNAVMNLLAP